MEISTELTAEIKLDILKQLKAGKKQKELAADYHVTESCMSKWVKKARDSAAIDPPIKQSKLSTVTESSESDPDTDDHKHPSAGNDVEQSTEPTFEELNEETLRQSLLMLVNDAYAKHEMTPQIIDKLQSYLDKKKAIQVISIERPRPSQEDTHVFAD